MGTQEVDFAGLARSLGVQALRVTEPDELTTQVRDGLDAGQPRLLDIAIER